MHTCPFIHIWKSCQICCQRAIGGVFDQHSMAGCQYSNNRFITSTTTTPEEKWSDIFYCYYYCYFFCRNMAAARSILSWGAKRRKREKKRTVDLSTIKHWSVSMEEEDTTCWWNKQKGVCDSRTKEKGNLQLEKGKTVQKRALRLRGDKGFRTCEYHRNWRLDTIFSKDKWRLFPW